jgi:hypothetical protein
MPSARALLVASLLTEPPYGCLGPPGNDRYRKRSLRSQTVGRFASELPKSRRFFRNESATSRRVRAGAIGGSTAMTRTAFCRKSPRVPRVCWLGSWALGTSDRGGQDKANWCSRTCRHVSHPESFVCTLDFWNRHGWRLTTFHRGRMAPFELDEEFQRAKRWRLRTSTKGSPLLIRSRARHYDFLQSKSRGSCARRIG